MSRLCMIGNHNLCSGGNLLAKCDCACHAPQSMMSDAETANYIDRLLDIGSALR